MLSNRTGLNHQDNYHQFCRLLGRLKANYQLNELVKTDGYLEWLELAASFTNQSVENLAIQHELDSLFASVVGPLGSSSAVRSTRDRSPGTCATSPDTSSIGCEDLH